MRNMKKILFICHGNICRSPMAEFILKDMLSKTPGYRPGEFLVESAATSREELGADMYPWAKKCLDIHGVPYTRRAARQMTKADYESFDFIIAMDDNNIRNTMRIIGSDPDGKVTKLLDWAGIDKSIADPWYTGEFDQTYYDIVIGCKALIAKFFDTEDK